jgi:predicted lipase
MACLAFTGTFFKSEWYDDINYKLIYPDKLVGCRSQTRVHNGFYQIYLSIRCQLWEWWTKIKGDAKHLFITGHSLGGALSTLAAFDFADEVDGDHFTHYSFASPRVGNVNFAHLYDKRVPNGIRIYNTEDIVPSLPPAAWLGGVYQHVCTYHGSVPFTKSLGSLGSDHTTAYFDSPMCFDNRAPCLL